MYEIQLPWCYKIVMLSLIHKHANTLWFLISIAVPMGKLGHTLLLCRFLCMNVWWLLYSRCKLENEPVVFIVLENPWT